VKKNMYKEEEIQKHEGVDVKRKKTDKNKK
jgi:hypothetical protein